MPTLDELRDRYGDGRICGECGREKPRMDRTPCFRCVLERVAQAEKAAAECIKRITQQKETAH